jgi:hypothetical protein
MNHRYILDNEGNPVPEPDIYKWAGWHADIGNRRVAYTTLDDGSYVSTVFLGTDHNFMQDGPPVLWETMTFNVPNDLGEFQERYTSEADARAGHLRIVKMLRDQIHSDPSSEGTTDADPHA